MSIPQVVFKYSLVYDEVLRFLKKKKKKKKISRREIVAYIKKINKAWKVYERKVFKEIASVLQLKWEEKFIPCYIVTETKLCFSDPLTIFKHKKQDLFIDILVHELIHRILSSLGNFQRCKKAWEYIEKRYKKKSKKTKNHIIVHAVHKHIYLGLFDEKRLRRDVKRAQKFKEYKEAWEIVQKEGYQNIINEFVKRIK
ncbi:hypothetical protein J7K03_00815 [bacterium]|nr:hypothetical protein [bacterium]